MIRNHSRVSCVSSNLSLLGLVAVLSGCLGVPAQYRTSSPIALEKGFFSGYKYTYEGGEPEKAFGLVTYSQSFKDVLAQQPAALAEAERGVPFHYIGLASSIAGLIHTLSWSLSSSSSSLPGTVDISGTDVAISVGLLAVGAFSNIKARGHFLDAVGMYNEAAAGPDNAGPWASLVSALPNSLQIDPFNNQYGLGWKLRAPRGW